MLEPVKDYKARHASTLLVFDAVEPALAKAEAKRGVQAAAGSVTWTLPPWPPARAT